MVKVAMPNRLAGSTKCGFRAASTASSRMLAVAGKSEKTAYSINGEIVFRVFLNFLHLLVTVSFCAICTVIMVDRIGVG
jgi:hypothetical protein